MYSRSSRLTHEACDGRSATRSHHSGAAITNGKTPSTKNSVRRVPQVRIQPDSGAVMIEAMAMFIIQYPLPTARVRPVRRMPPCPSPRA